MAEVKKVALQTAIWYVAGAYIGIWLILFGYLLFLGSRVSSLFKQVEALKEEVSKEQN